MAASYIVAIACFFVALVSCEVVQENSPNLIADSTSYDVLPPSKDPWYLAPVELAFSNPGDVVKLRESPGNLTSVLKNLKSSTQMLYRTTTGQGFRKLPAHAVTTVLVPKKPDPLLKEAVSYQVPYESSCLDASPSYGLATASDSIPLDLLDRLLGLGWLVIVPDYEGTMASFGAPRLAGFATLDSIKAVSSVGMERFGLDPDFDVAIWGYSGGALATAWAHVLMKSYAVDMYICAVSIGGLPADILRMMEINDGSAHSSLVFNAIAGLSNEYPELDQQVALAAKRSGPFNVSAFAQVKTMSTAQSRAHFAHHQTQIYVYHGMNDEVAPIDDVDALVKKWCRVHRALLIFDSRFQPQVWYHRFILGDHQAVGEFGVDHTLEFFKKEFLYRRNKRDMEFSDHRFYCETRELTMVENSADLGEDEGPA
ncbi:hypothetical protein NQ176_g4133 [Zarea fungicola]|uniref:Uncharacterized protein n=1 Tax=Zarea fungicola TaxID=93591 RepID=A0ACC1NHG8_9HYPO|nr:hypothetical protein NQ176_g4133 [Lecanicillium fungicola]